MLDHLNQSKGSTTLFTNLESIARIFGVGKKAVKTTKVGNSLTGVKVLFDKTEQRCWLIPKLVGEHKIKSFKAPILETDLTSIDLTDFNIQCENFIKQTHFSFEEGFTLNYGNDAVCFENVWYAAKIFPVEIGSKSHPDENWYPLQQRIPKIFFSFGEMQEAEIIVGERFLLQSINGDHPHPNWFVLKEEPDGILNHKVKNGYAVSFEKMNCLNILDFGAKEVDPELNKTAIITAIEASKGTGLPIFIPKGVWKINRLVYELKHDNITIFGEDGTVLSIEDRFVLGAYPTNTGIKKNHQIANMTISGAGDSAYFTYDGSMVEGIQFKNLSFYNIGGHYIDSCGSTNIKIENICVYGSTLKTTDRQYVECFQLSTATPDGQTWRHPEYDEFMNGQSTRDVLMDNCHFFEHENKYCQRPIGDHAIQAAPSVENITIQNCSFSGINPTHIGADRLRQTGMLNLYVSGTIDVNNNKYTGLDLAGARTRPFITFVIKDTPLQTAKTLRITNNELINVGGYVEDSEILIEEMTPSAYQVAVKENKISYLGKGNPQNIIQIKNISGSNSTINISSNNVDNCRFLLYADNVKNGIVSLNIVNKSNRSFIRSVVENGGVLHVQGNTIISGSFITTQGYQLLSISNNTWVSTNDLTGELTKIRVGVGEKVAMDGNMVLNPPLDTSNYVVQSGNEILVVQPYEYKIVK